MEEKEEKKRWLKFLEGVKLPSLPTLSGLPVKRFAIVGGLILVALIAGIVVGEIGLVGQAAGAAKVWITGRLPLQEWEIAYPTSFRPTSGIWIGGRSEENEATLQHDVSSPVKEVSAEALELELVCNPGGTGRGNLGVKVWVDYAGGSEGDVSVEFTAQELAAVVRATGGQTAKIRIPLDSTRPIGCLGLVVRSDSPRLWEVVIARAELILR